MLEEAMSMEGSRPNYNMNIRINDVSRFREEYREYKLKISNGEPVERNETFETIQNIMNNTDLDMNKIDQWDECNIETNGKVRGWNWDVQDMSGPMSSSI